VAFSDGFPFLIISENSLAALNYEMQLNLPMTRFRPNLLFPAAPLMQKTAGAKSALALLISGSQTLRPLSVQQLIPKPLKTGKEPLITLNRTRKWQIRLFWTKCPA